MKTEFELTKASMTGPSHYSFEDHQKLKKGLFLKSTAQIGWSGRWLYGESALDPYRTWRDLQFRRFLIELRDAVLEQLNLLLSEAGKKLGRDLRLELDGVITLGDIETAEGDLASGARSLSDLARLAG